MNNFFRELVSEPEPNRIRSTRTIQYQARDKTESRMVKYGYGYGSKSVRFRDKFVERCVFLLDAFKYFF